MSLEALSGNINLLEKLSHFNLRVKGKSQKKVYSNIYDFWVDTDKVLVLKKDNYISYTLPIYKEGEEKTDTIQNLFLHPYNGGFLAYLFTYNFDKTDRENLKNGVPIQNILTKLTFRPLDNIDIDFSDTNSDVSYVTTGGGFKAGDVILYEGQCWRVNHVTLYTDGSYEATVTLCTDCTDCGGGGGSGDVSSAAGLTQQPFQFIDIRGWTPGGGSSSSTGNPGGGAFNPGDSNIIPGGGGIPNGEPVIGIIDPDLKVDPDLQALANFKFSLMQDNYNYWVNPANASNVELIKGFLKDYNYSYESKDIAVEMIESLRLGTDISLKPFFKYPPGSNYETLYPHFTLEVKQYIPEMKNDIFLINTIKNLTQLS